MDDSVESLSREGGVFFYGRHGEVMEATHKKTRTSSNRELSGGIVCI